LLIRESRIVILDEQQLRSAVWGDQNIVGVAITVRETPQGHMDDIFCRDCDCGVTLLGSDIDDRCKLLESLTTIDRNARPVACV
jgi:hypothetical protein